MVHESNIINIVYYYCSIFIFNYKKLTIVKYSIINTYLKMPNANNNNMSKFTKQIITGANQINQINEIKRSDSSIKYFASQK